MSDDRTSPTADIKAACRPETFAWSVNEENYYGDFNSREDAVAEAAATYPDHSLIWTGVQVRPDSREWLPDARHIIERMQERAWDDHGEFSETFLDGLTKEQEAELTKAVGDAIDTWIGKHGLHPTFFTVTNIKEHVLETEAGSA